VSEGILVYEKFGIALPIKCVRGDVELIGVV
jgi:hypothetical protein